MTAPAHARRARRVRTSTARRKYAGLLAAVTVLALAVPTALVTAAVTASSRVDGNVFGVSPVVDLGVHALDVVTASGRDTLRPGDEATVGFGLTPADRPTVPAALRAGDEVSVSVVLPSWLVPGTLPEPSRDLPHGAVSWASAQDPDDGTWTVTRTTLLEDDQEELTAQGRAEFPVTASTTAALAPGTVTAAAHLPERIASAAATDAVEVDAISHVDIGVHDLAVTPTGAQRFTEGTAGRVSFLLTPAPATTPRATHFRAGEQLVHEFTLPSWLTPQTLPVHLPNASTATVWKSEQDPDDGTWTVRRTQDFFVDRTEYNAAALGFDVLATGTPVEGDLVRGAVTLPGRLVSNAPDDAVDALAAARVPVGVHDLAVTPASGTAFLPRATGTASFSTTPGAAPVAVALAADDTVTHTLTLPRGLTAGELPAATGTVVWTSTPGTGGTTVVTRTETFPTAVTEYPGVAVTFPVVATTTPGASTGTVTGTATLPTHAVSSAQPAAAVVSFTTTTSVGVHLLTAVPDTGSRFVPGGSGTVSFLATPSTATTAPFPVGVGDVLTHTISLPRGLTPGTLPGPQDLGTSSTRWLPPVQHGDGTWTVTVVETFSAPRSDYTAAALLALPVTAGSDLVDQAPLTVRVTLPEPLTSSAGQMSIPLPVAPSSDVGVHGLRLIPTTGTQFMPWMPGTLEFRTTRTGGPVAVQVPDGTVVQHAVTLPSWFEEVVLPHPVTTPGVSKVEWSTTGATLTRTETFTRAQTQYQGSTVRLDVRVVDTPSNQSGTAAVAVSVHGGGFTPTESSAQVSVTSTNRTDVGVHLPAVQPATGSEFSLGSRGTVSFQTGPDLTTQVPMTARGSQSHAVTYTVTLPSWLTPGDLPELANSGNHGTGKKAWSKRQTGGVWTVTFSDTFSADRTGYNAGRLSFPVEATGVPVTGSTVTLKAAVPTMLVSNRGSATVPVTAAAVPAVAVGVHGLDVHPVNPGPGSTQFMPSMPGDLTFRTTPNGTPLAVQIAPGTTVTHTITLPAWLPNVSLPSETGTLASTVEWTQRTLPAGKTLTRTETFHSAVSQYPGEAITVPVRASTTSGTSTAAVTASVAVAGGSFTSAPAAASGQVSVTSTLITDVGVHDLVMAQDDPGPWFSGKPGTVSFQTGPDLRTQVPMTAVNGKVLRYSVVLPSWLEPVGGTAVTGAAPAGGAHGTGTKAWSASKSGLNWTVTFTDTFSADRTGYNAGRVEIPVLAVGRPSVSRVTVTATPPTPLTSAYPSAYATADAFTGSFDGVYDLRVSSVGMPDGSDAFRPGEWGTVSFAPHQDAAARVNAVTYLPQDVLTYSVMLPSWLVPRALPGGSDDATSTVVWSSRPASDGRTEVLRTETFKKSTQATGAVPRWTVDVKATDTLSTQTAQVTVTAQLPRELWPMQNTRSTQVRALSQPYPYGAYHLVMEPGGSWTGKPELAGWSSVELRNPVAAQLRRGDVITERVWFATSGKVQIYRIPGNSDDGTLRITWRLESEFAAVRTIEVLRDVTNVTIPSPYITRDFYITTSGNWGGTVGQHSGTMYVDSTWPERFGVIGSPRGSVTIHWQPF